MSESSLILQQGQLKVLLIGDQCTDQYIFGSVDRISPEAPVPVLKIDSEPISAPGMSLNVKANLENLGCYVIDVTNREDILKTRYIDSKTKQQLLRVDYEGPIEPWHGTLEPEVMEWIDVVIVSDYNKGFLSYEQIEYIISQAKCPVFIDTKKPDLSRFSSDNVFVKINEDEYNKRFSIPKNLIVTLGSEGAKLFEYKTEKAHCPTKEIEITDVCGCGDTFLASVATRYASNGNDIVEAMQFANKAASITVQHRGNYAPTMKEIDNA